MHFALICIDKPDAMETRLATRAAHLDYVRKSNVALGGPFLNEAGEMIGSLIVIEAEDLAKARAWAENDPYARAGLFERVDVRPFRAAIGSWVSGPSIPPAG
ncbi:MAG: YciI family protein [Alphaproteobacteria bacterium]|nr:YciI family protein [Alphaproteobacteria bacterium]